jgi:predicted SAM-dependent methyltransferase
MPSFCKPAALWIWSQILKVSLWIMPPRKPVNPGGKVYLNLGSGFNTHPSFINVDLTAARHIHYRRPVNDLRPFADNSVDLIYVSHCLEHFPHAQVDSVLKEWYRVLKPEGILRIGVPDFEKLLEVYHANNHDIESIQEVLMGGQTYPLNFHYCTFTKRSLTDRLKKCGFKEARIWQRGADELSNLSDATSFSLSTPNGEVPISLNIEGIK